MQDKTGPRSPPLATARSLPETPQHAPTTSRGLPPPAQDKVHPNAVFMMEALNVILNMHKQHVACSGSKGAPISGFSSSSGGGGGGGNPLAAAAAAQGAAAAPGAGTLSAEAVEAVAQAAQAVQAVQAAPLKPAHHRSTSRRIVLGYIETH